MKRGQVAGSRGMKRQGCKQTMDFLVEVQGHFGTTSHHQMIHLKSQDAAVGRAIDTVHTWIPPNQCVREILKTSKRQYSYVKPPECTIW